MFCWSIGSSRKNRFAKFAFLLSFLVLLHVSSPLPSSDYTYFYKGKEYWKFDNQKLMVEPGYPKSILRDWMGCNQSGMERSGSKGNRGDRQLPLDDVDIMVTINDVPTTVNAIAVVIPCILSLCILVLVYTIFQFKNKGGQQTTMTPHYYKYPVQEWVWQDTLLWRGQRLWIKGGHAVDMLLAGNQWKINAERKVNVLARKKRPHTENTLQSSF